MGASDRFNIRQQQIARKIEAVKGVAETLAAADVEIDPFQSNLTPTGEPIRFANDQVSDSIGAAEDFVSAVAGTLTYGYPFATSGIVGTPAAVGKDLRACGLQEYVVNAITIGAPAGGDATFTAGSAYTATGGKSGLIEQTISTGGTLRYIPLVGGALVATDVVDDGGGTTATASGTNALYAVRYSPRSTGHENMTIQRAIKNDAGTAGEDRLFRLAGALGNATIALAALDAVRINFDFRGAVDYEDEGSLLTGFTLEAGSAPKFKNAICQINGVGVSPSSIEINLGNVVTLEPEPTTIGGTDGFEFARIEGREPTITIDPFSVPHDILDDAGLLRDGTIVPFQLTCGTTPNIIEFSATRCQVRTNTSGARSGREIRQITLHVVRSTVPDNDYFLYMR